MGPEKIQQARLLSNLFSIYVAHECVCRGKQRTQPWRYLRILRIADPHPPSERENIHISEKTPHLSLSIHYLHVPPARPKTVRLHPRPRRGAQKFQFIHAEMERFFCISYRACDTIHKSKLDTPTAKPSASLSPPNSWRPSPLADPALPGCCGCCSRPS